MTTVEVMPFLVPITFILGGFAVGIVAMIMRSHAKERTHRERMFMAEKGLPVPRELYEIPVEKRPSEFRGVRTLLMVFGAILIFVGLGVMFALGVRDGMGEGINGLIPLLIGVGFLVAERMILKWIVRVNGNHLQS